MGPPVKCDCTMHCGDDPWLKDGRAWACAYKVRTDREYAEATARWHRERELLGQLGLDSALQGLEELARLRANVEAQGPSPAR